MLLKSGLVAQWTYFEFFSNNDIKRFKEKVGEKECKKDALESVVGGQGVGKE
jgi:hypothetical protein